MKIKSISFSNVENTYEFDRWLEQFVEKCLIEQLVEVSDKQKVELKVSKYRDLIGGDPYGYEIRSD